MNKNSRTKNSIINSIYASGSQIITILLSFVVRTVFIKTLSMEYLGVNGLFSNIITMLSLADLGIGISIPYTLYKPLAEDNKSKIKSLMNLYSKIYTIIGIIVFVVGIALMPVLKYILKEIPDIKDLNFIYFLFVINSACSYFFIYKKLLLDSDQKGYMANKIIMNVTIVKSVVEIIILYITKNYIIYLLFSILTTIVQNIIISMKCNKTYPYIKEKTIEKVTKEDILSLRKNTFALIIYRIGTIAMNGTDSIIISSFVGINMVGIYSNYLLIVNAITNVISQIFNAITSSIGNLVVTKDNIKGEDVFYKLLFLDFWLYTICGICIIILINPFIKLWAGETYLLSNIVAFAIGLNLYIYGMQNVVSSYRNAYGLFVQGKYRPIIMVIVNVILSIVLVKYIGILGVIIATIISRLFVTGIYDPIVVFKYGFNASVKKYFIMYAKYIIAFILIAIIGLIVVSYISIDNYITWVAIAIIIGIIVNLILILLFYKNDNLKFYKEKIKGIINSKIKKV